MPLRTCRVSLRDPEGVVHSVEVQADSLYEAAAAAMAAFREQGWAAQALTPAAKLRVEVMPPAVVHEVPVAAVERWLRSGSTSPRDALIKKVSGRK
jgi:hypothetical protein